jgi:succinate dehydrogenase hydrophobic anchor subunit
MEQGWLLMKFFSQYRRFNLNALLLILAFIMSGVGLSSLIQEVLEKGFNPINLFFGGMMVLVTLVAGSLVVFPYEPPKPKSLEKELVEEEKWFFYKAVVQTIFVASVTIAIVFTTFYLYPIKNFSYSTKSSQTNCHSDTKVQK